MAGLRWEAGDWFQVALWYDHREEAWMMVVGDPEADQDYDRSVIDQIWRWDKQGWNIVQQIRKKDRTFLGVANHQIVWENKYCPTVNEKPRWMDNTMRNYGLMLSTAGYLYGCFGYRPCAFAPEYLERRPPEEMYWQRCRQLPLQSCSIQSCSIVTIIDPVVVLRNRNLYLVATEGPDLANLDGPWDTLLTTPTMTVYGEPGLLHPAACSEDNGSIYLTVGIFPRLVHREGCGPLAITSPCQIVKIWNYPPQVLIPTDLPVWHVAKHEAFRSELPKAAARVELLMRISSLRSTGLSALPYELLFMIFDWLMVDEFHRIYDAVPPFF